SLSGLDVQVDLVPRLFEIVGPKVTMHSLEGVALLGLPPARRITGLSRVLKRALDVTVSAVAICVAAPLMVFIAWRVKRDSPGPIFFRQVRLGGGMREFTALKYRTMKVDTDQEEHRRYIRETAKASVATNANGLFKLERKDAI